MTVMPKGRPHGLLAALCAGIALANVSRMPLPVAFAAASILAGAAAVVPAGRLPLLALGLVVGGWWLGSMRLDQLDRSILMPEIGRAERSVVVVTGPVRRGRFDLKLPVQVRRFGRLAADENAELELPLGRSPPQGAVLDVRAEAKLPRGPSLGLQSC